MRHLRQVCVCQGLEAGKWLLPNASQLRLRVTTLIWATGIFPRLLSLAEPRYGTWMQDMGRNIWCGIYALNMREQVLVSLTKCLDLLLVFFK